MGNKPTIKPLNKRIIVRPLEVEAQTSSGIIIPDTSQEKPEKGVVVEAGESILVSNGETVIFSKYGYDPIKVEGEELYVISEGSLLAKYEN